MDAALRRKLKDHERYMRQREQRLVKQREYYYTHKEQCKESVKRSVKKKAEQKLSCGKRTDRQLYTENIIRFAQSIKRHD